MGSLERVLGLEINPEAEELARVIGELTADSVRRGRVAPDEAAATQEHLLRIANGHHLPDVAIAATLEEVGPSVESTPVEPHRVTTLVLDDTLAA